VQALGRSGTRDRSGAFPFELAYRLILMYAIKGDTVLDPFWGTGTTALAAAAAGRNSIGYEIDSGLGGLAVKFDRAALAAIQRVLHARLEQHAAFVRDWETRRAPLKYRNRHYGFAVMTRQEQDLFIDVPRDFVTLAKDELTCRYDATSLDWARINDDGGRIDGAVNGPPPTSRASRPDGQLKLF
jgi:hypothetical protein